ncbi:tetratricopeptide repeat-containing sensor histidine kinase [Flavobacterium sp.]|uniref:tetratricopeptide repeat-containing sensor histidine kinase n=1 Tax=Flavobacterium sp. TaxID=239 RepID=UPI004048A75A
MKKNILLILILIFFEGVIAQTKLIDSLKIELKSHRKDTIRVNLLYDLAFETFQKDTKLANSYIVEAEQLSESLNFTKGKARINYLKGILDNIKGDYVTSLKYFNLSLKHYKTINDKRGIASNYTAFGITHYDQAEYEKAIQSYLNALEIYENIGNKREVITCLINIGNVYSEIGDFDKAISNYNKALNKCKLINDENGISFIHSNLGILYKKQGNYYLAIENSNESLYYRKKTADTLEIAVTLNNLGEIYNSMKDVTKALLYHQKSLELALKQNNKKIIVANEINIGNIYKEQKEYKKALVNYNKSLQTSSQINDLKSVAICFANIATIYLALENSTLARTNFIKANEISEDINNLPILTQSELGISETFLFEKNYKKALFYALKGRENAIKLDLLLEQRKAAELLSQIYNNTGNYKKALESHEQFKKLSDSLLNEENIKKIASIEYEYKYKKELNDAAERETKLTETVETTSKDLEKSQRNLLLGIITFLAVAMVLGSIIFYLKLRNSKAKTQNIITEQKLLRTQMTPHFIFNSLSVLQGMILNSEENKSVSYLSKFSKLLRITLENSRDKTVLLSQELEAVENYLSLQNIENEKITFQLYVDDAIETNTIKVPPMLIQPFVENAIEHAFKNQKDNCVIEIKLTLVDTKLICVILDNGMGIDSSERNSNQNKKSLATKITKERLDYLSKDFKMDASIAIEDRTKYNAQGTQVTIQIPYSTTEL